MVMRKSFQRIGQAVVAVALAALVAAPSVLAQASSTFNGRVADQDDAVLPGVTITLTNDATGVTRTGVTNEQGLYFMPGLEPGTYTLRTELPGFAPSVREKVALGINATISIDFKMGLAGVSEAITVTGAAPLIEVSQSKMATSIEATELRELPMITRTISGMLTLLPGAAPVAELHRTKANVGTVSYGGSSGANVVPTVDGADNRDNHYGGPLMSFTTESLEQFQLATSQFTAADGRTGGAAVSMVTKSGTNVLHGSAFIYERDKALTSKDFFTQQRNQEKLPFSRQQFGGSIGGPILRNRMFFFGAAEQMIEDIADRVPDNVYNQLQALVTARTRGNLPAGLVNPNHPRFGERPGALRMISVKTNFQLNNSHSLIARVSTQKDNREAVTWATNNDRREQENSNITAESYVGQHSWVIGGTSLNQITAQVNHMRFLGDSISNITGEHYIRDFPNVNIFPPRLAFPTVNTGQGGAGGTTSNRYVIQFKNDFSSQQGAHSLKFGANYNDLQNLGIINANEHFATLTFFDDPSTILNNTNGRYPQGFQTPGIIRQWQQANGGAVNGVGYLSNTETDAKQFGTWFQDDWRVKQNLTLNLGIRYDIDYNLMDQKNHHRNAARMALEAIGSPYGGFPQQSKRDISPRIGFAWDMSGDGARVLRGGYGLYFDQYNTAAAAGDITALGRRPLNALATLTNTAIGAGQLANFRLGIDPLPPAPTEADRIPRDSEGQWLDPAIKDPRAHQIHLGYAHTLAANTVITVDYTRVEGRNEMRQLQLNPVINGTRILAPDFQRVFGNPDALSSVFIRAGINESQYDALTFRVQRRFPRATLQAHYTLAKAYSFGGSTGNRSGAGLAQDYDKPFADSEWGPNGPDERHRVVATGVFDVGWGVQFSPVLQLASARPYNLTAGTDLNRDGTNNDRWIDPATGQQVSLNAARGDHTFVVDLRSTKFINFGGERRLGLFVEGFNLFNTVNFGNAYNGNGRSTLFRQPTGYIPGIGYPRQMQLGARFLF